MRFPPEARSFINGSRSTNSQSVNVDPRDTIFVTQKCGGGDIYIYVYRETKKNREKEKERRRELSEGTTRKKRGSRRSAREIQKTHGTQREYWNASLSAGSGRGANTRDVQTPVAKQFFDRISARTWFGLCFFDSLAHPTRYRTSQIDRSLSFRRETLSEIFLQCSSRKIV